MKDEILNQNQKKIIKKMEFLKNNFYLAGGTALALQLGHRTSKDFDFYSKKDFDSKKLYLDFKKEFSKDISEPIYSENTLEFKIGITDISFFKYPYNLIGPFDNYKLLLLANIKDIAAMKVEAIIGRGTKRDFIDIYFLIKKFSLKKILEFTKKKYPETFNEYLCLRSLLYFKDAETKQNRSKIRILNSNINWQSIKNYIIKEVKDYVLK
ncbi:nucleotidyl transferase AbiEii/AbiGii toxin family protein [Patescibacteria group bacterium]|nr:nucleotidyl transferase AbiEii/AbiGii toxin family protein [Patescibacteria group bacterium]